MGSWDKFLNSARRRATTNRRTIRGEGRREFERDYDRILFSTPVRRMADKTQVYPLESRDGVRTRLTHSHEVAALARGVGLDLVSRYHKKIGMNGSVETLRDVSALMSAIGLVHDIGNPPFGHQGENAIGQWFKTNYDKVFSMDFGVTANLAQDFVRFEGNAQTLRLVSKLAIDADGLGLNLTYGVLAGLLKYTVPAHESDKDSQYAASHKPGFFQSEASIVAEIWDRTGLPNGRRHPLTFLMEACDDIAYSVIDVEDTVKKDLASYPDVKDYVQSTLAGEPIRICDKQLIDGVLKETERRRTTFLNQMRKGLLSPKELDDVSMQFFRVGAISAMVRSVLQTFVKRFRSIEDGSFRGDLLEASDARRLRKLLKRFLGEFAFQHNSVLAVELSGSLVIRDLMDRLWKSITDRADAADLRSPRQDRLSAYTYSRISENYRKTFESSSSVLPVRYREAQLLTDMISGMTDTFAGSLLADLKQFDSKPFDKQAVNGLLTNDSKN
jgi:dGTPase